MKKILVTGKDSYIGTAFENWAKQWPDNYSVDSLDVRTEEWKKHDFSKYEVIVHVAAIVHVKEKDQSLYNKVNRDLAFEIASNAKKMGVSQFIFMSTMGVYGLEAGRICTSTNPNPATPYAKSKYEAELKISSLISSEFQVCILRPPLVYGKGCKGNYRTLSKFSKMIFSLPSYDNYRSMLYIDNLSNFLLHAIDLNLAGVLFPQNEKYVSVPKLISLIREINDKKTYRLFFLNGIKILIPLSKTLAKIFGSLTYDESMHGSPANMAAKFSVKYDIVDLEDSILQTEGDNDERG